MESGVLVTPPDPYSAIVHASKPTRYVAEIVHVVPLDDVLQFDEPGVRFTTSGVGDGTGEPATSVSVIPAYSVFGET
jgi:hypothetical protein